MPRRPDSSSCDPPALVQALTRLVTAGVVPRVSGALARGRRKAGESLRSAVLAEVLAFSQSGNPQVLPELERHAGEHLEEIVRLMGGGKPGALDFVRVHAHRRAEQRFPLEATLHAYRCGHKVLSHWIRDAAAAAASGRTQEAATAVADFAIEYTNAISTVCAAEYVARTRALAEAEGDRRTELLSILLSGYDESDGRVARMLKRAGYLEQRQSFCVVLAQSTDPLQMENPAREQRIVQAIADAVAGKPFRSLIGIRNNAVTAVFSDTRRLSGWTAPQARLAERLESALLMLGPAVLVGISTDQPSTSFIPRALHEASVALDFASVGERVMQYSKLPLRRLILHRAADYVQAAMPAWSADLSAADEKTHGALVCTLQALANADMNVQQAARALKLHANTVYARLERVRELTGLNAQKFHDLTELLLAADCRIRPALP